MGGRMMQEFNYRGHKIEVWTGKSTTRYYIYKDGQFLLKSKETDSTNIHKNGLLQSAKWDVEAEIAKGVLKKRLSKFGYPFNNIK